MRKIIIMIIAFCACFTACRTDILTGQTEAVKAVLPDWDEKALGTPIVRWEITVSDAHKKVNFFVDAPKGTADDGTKGQSAGQGAGKSSSFLVDAEKNRPLCITARPITLKDDGTETAFFYPAGAVYPYEFCDAGKKSLFAKEENGGLSLTWESGFTADIMERFFMSARNEGYGSQSIQAFTESFNWKKFCQTIFSKNQESIDALGEGNSSSEIFYNPWLTDAQGILEGIGYENFKASLLSMKNVFSAPVENIEDIFSPYVPENTIKNTINRLSLKKNELNFFSLSNTYGIILTGNSASNVSRDFISLPIYINDI